MPEKKTKVKLPLKNLAKLPSYFDYIFVHLRQKVRLRPEIFVNVRPEPDSKSPARFTTLLHTAVKPFSIWLPSGVSRSLSFETIYQSGQLSRKQIVAFQEFLSKLGPQLGC